MEAKKTLGIWMDHSKAVLIDLKSDKNNHNIDSEFDSETQSEVMDRSEKTMHNKRQQMQQAFYKEIAAEILKYEHVVLFGPTNAKTELHNYLNKDLHFKDIKICIESAEKMSDNEKEAFVRNHFNK